jgi:cobyrinic acid a,c-diamide synthase
MLKAQETGASPAEDVSTVRRSGGPNPRGLVVAGAGSGSGKTLSTLALLCGLSSRGRQVHPFKCGPDFIDPRYHEWIAGRPSFSLDLHFSGAQELRERFDRLTVQSSGGVIEGVMGLYDGMDRGTSTHDIARTLDLPLLLVINAQGMADTLAAIVKGLAGFRSGVGILGVVASRTGSDRHRAMLERSLSSEGLPPLVGVLPRRESLRLPERHLGLVGPGSLTPREEETFREAIASVAGEFDWDRIDTAFRSPSVLSPEKAGLLPGSVAGPEEGALPSRYSFTEAAKEGIRLLSEGTGLPSMPPTLRLLRLGVAMDEAFWFYYPENWEVFRRHGITFEFFSPLSDRALPPGLDGLYLGGGYPEVHAGLLSGNRSLVEEIRGFCEDGRPVYAECGGMLYLTRGPVDETENRPESDNPDSVGLPSSGEGGTALVGVIPVHFSTGERLKRLGYAEVAPAGPGLFGSAVGAIRGHLFHYSRLRTDPPGETGGMPLQDFGAAFRHSTGNAEEGFSRGNLVASYLHLFFSSNESYADSLAAAMRGSR